MLVNDMEKTITKWRRDAEKRRKRRGETPEKSRERAEQEMEQLVKRGKRRPKSDEDLKREYDREIEKLRKQAKQNRAPADSEDT
jgi:hypothetical protein